MRNLILAGILSVATATAGHATGLALNNFDAENGGNSALNYAAYSNLTVGSGSTDLIKSGDYGINCAGGTGSCVDLDGSTNSGGRLDTASFAYTAGRTYTLSFDLSGNQRGYGSDSFYAGFNFATPVTLAFYSIGGAFGNAQIFQGVTTTQVTSSAGIGDTDPFTTYSIGFKATNSGTFNAFVGTFSSDNVGPVLDNFSLTSDVPEPATWGLMIMGFGLAGTALRRHSLAAA